MDIKEDKKQQEYSGNLGALKREGEKKLKDKAKKAIIKKVIAIIGAKAIIIGGIIASALGILLFFASADFVVNEDAESSTNDAKAYAVSTSYSTDASTTATDEDGNTVNKVVVSTNENKTGFEIKYNNDAEYIEDVKNMLEDEEIVDSASDFTDYELAVLGALIENGANLDFYTEDMLKCLPAFVKAEAATQNLDLRPNSEKQSGKNTGDYIDNYQPQKIEDLVDGEVAGTILVQRTNTEGTIKTTLEYKAKEEFYALVQENNKEAINYFTIGDDGNLIVAKWENILVTIPEGQYPENLEETEKVNPTKESGEDIINTEPIAYSQYIAEFKMPFELLNQLLIITEEPEFCMELVNYALNSKIVINIQEEKTVTVIDETRNYRINSKDEKYINYEVDVAGQQIVKEDKFLNYAKDEDTVECTNYYTPPKVQTVKIHKEYTSHSYSFGIIEADTWIGYYKEKPQTQTGITSDPTTINLNGNSSNYKQINIENSQPITDQTTINQDKDVTKFINETKTNYEPKIIVPQSVTIGEVVTDEDGNKFKLLNVNYNDGTTKEYKRCPEIKDDKGNGTGEYSLPAQIVITTDKVASTAITKEIPQINYVFKLKISTNLFGQTIYSYELETNIDPLVNCIVSSLKIDEFEKIELLDTSTVTTTVTKYPADPNPLVEKHIYAINNETGEFEKFLAAFDKSEGAQNMLNSIDSWLYEMMENNGATEEFEEHIKYLLYKYDGVDRGVTELNLDLFNSSKFANFSNGTGWWWPIGSSNVEIINGKEFARGEPVSSTIISGVGPRWGKNHGGIDVSNGVRGTNIIASKSGTVITVVDGFGDGHAHVNGSVHGSQKVCNGECKQGGGYGNYIKIQHDDGTSSIYAHLERGTIKVSKDDRVEQGQLLGGMGTSGSSTGIHLHFEIRDTNNNRLDPEDYVDPENARQTTASASLRGWLWGIEGGNEHINGNIWTVFDPEGDDNTMNLAHGMVIASYNGADSWYPDIIPGKITVGQTITVEQAGKVWEKKIKGFNDAIDLACAKYGVTLTPNQKDALVSYIYRTGYGVGQNNSIVSAYASAGNAGLWDYMKNGYDKRPEYETGTKKRVAEEYELFVKGDYNYDPNGTAKYDQYCNNPNI